MKDLIERLSAQMEAELFAAICGPASKPRPTALRVRGNWFETVELDESGNVIEPPRPCPHCGPVLLCAFHMTAITPAAPLWKAHGLI